MTNLYFWPFWGGQIRPTNFAVTCGGSSSPSGPLPPPNYYYCYLFKNSSRHIYSSAT